WLETPDEAGADGQPTTSQVRDPASQHAIEAIRNLYRINAEDQQSVQQAWTRLIQRAQETASEQNTPRPLEVVPEVGKLFKRRGKVRKTMRLRRRVLLAACITAFLLLGSFVSLLVISPQKDSQSGKRTSTVVPTQQGMQTIPPPGTRLGNV